MIAMDEAPLFSIICMERTGSHLLRQILSSHIEHVLWQPRSSELNTAHGGEWLSRKPRHELGMRYQKTFDTDETFATEAEHEDEARRRLLVYQQLDTKPIAKLIHRWTHDFVLDWFVKNTSVILLDRKSQLDTSLSYALAKRNEFWLMKDDHYNPKKIVISQDECEEWEKAYLSFQAFAQSIKPYCKIYYEDFVDNHIHPLVVCDIPPPYNVEVTTRKLFEKNKLDYVENPGFVEKWFSSRGYS